MKYISRPNMLIMFIKPDFEFSDDRGSLKQLVHNGWKQVNYITSVGKAFRGNHYHKENREAFYVIKGRFRLIVSTIDGSIKEEYEMKSGDFFIIDPMVVHSFDYLEDTDLISFYDKGVENEKGDKDIFQ